MNKCFPSEVYIPVAMDLISVAKKKKNLSGLHAHKILSVRTEHAIGLHSKDRAPYHILLEVAYQGPFRSESSDYESEHSSRSRAGSGSLLPKAF